MLEDEYAICVLALLYEYKNAKKKWWVRLSLETKNVVNGSRIGLLKDLRKDDRTIQF